MAVLVQLARQGEDVPFRRALAVILRGGLLVAACLSWATAQGWAAPDSLQAGETKVPSAEGAQSRQDVPKAAAPVVSYQDGRLTVEAENEPLASVLKLIAEKTGAVIDVPVGTGLERIVAHAGPGPAGEVLKELLEGSEYNFVVLRSQQPTHELREVLLTMRPADATFEADLASAQAANRQAAEAAAVAARSQGVTAEAIPNPDKPAMSHEEMLKARAEWFRRRALQKPQKPEPQPQAVSPPQEVPATLPTPVTPQ